MKILSLIAVFLLMSLNIYCQLNNNAERLRGSDLSPIYNQIKQKAQGDWGTDHNMIVYQINNQADAFVELIEIFQNIQEDETRQEIFVRSLEEWQYKSGGDSVLEYADYKMALYTYRKQTKALASY